MGGSQASSGGKPPVHFPELIARIKKGDQTAAEEAWNALDRNHDGVLTGHEQQKCLDICTSEILAHLDTMDPHRKDILAKGMVPAFMKKSLDPNNDGKIAKDEYVHRVTEALRWGSGVASPSTLACCLTIVQYRNDV